MRTTPTLILAAALLAASAALTGCNIAVPVFFAVQGPPKLPGAFEPDAGRTTVLLIDDPRNKVPRRELRLNIGQVADENLLRHKVFPAGMLISSKSALAASRGSEQGPKLSVVDIGRRVGAQVVIYVEVTDWTLVSNGEGISPQAAVSIRVLDPLSNERLFPAEGGLTVVASLPPEAESKQPNRGVLERALAKELGTAISEAFFDHERRQMQSNRGAIQ